MSIRISAMDAEHYLVLYCPSPTSAQSGPPTDSLRNRVTLAQVAQRHASKRNAPQVHVLQYS